MSDDYLTEFKPFDSQLQATNCERLQSTEVVLYFRCLCRICYKCINQIFIVQVTSLETTMKSQQGSAGLTDSCLFSTIHPPQTLPQRPTSLYLPPNKKSPAASSRPKLGKLKFLHEQVQLGFTGLASKAELVTGCSKGHLGSGYLPVQ